MTLMKLRLGFLVTDFSQQFGIYLVVFTLKVFIRVKEMTRYGKMIATTPKRYT